MQYIYKNISFNTKHVFCYKVEIHLKKTFFSKAVHMFMITRTTQEKTVIFITIKYSFTHKPIQGCSTILAITPTCSRDSKDWVHSHGLLICCIVLSKRLLIHLISKLWLKKNVLWSKWQKTLLLKLVTWQYFL